jgi:uncharacterized protein (AIM24 family)
MGVDAAGNAYVAATFSGPAAIIDRGNGFDTLDMPEDNNMLVAKYDAGGRLLWHTLVSDADSIHVTTLATTTGGIWIGGSFTRTVDLGEIQLTSAGRSDAFIAMIDSNGAFRRAARAGGTSTDECEKMAVDRNGEIVIAGQFRGTASFGDQALTATGGANFFLARYRADGTVAWAHADGGPAFTPAQTFTPMPILMTLDADGNIYLAISYLGSIAINGNTIQSASEADALILKYRPDGSGAWIAAVSGDFLQLVEGLAVDTDGSVYIAGFSQDLPEGTLFLAKLTSAGEQVWQAHDQSAGALSGAEGGPICIDRDHTIYMAGHFSGKTRFGGRTLTSFESSDSSVAGDDVFIATIGSASGVRAGADRAAGRASFTVARRDRQLLLLPAPGAPAVLSAGLYSTLGEHVAAPSAGFAGGEAIRFDTDGLAAGMYLIAARTAWGEVAYAVAVGR